MEITHAWLNRYLRPSSPVSLGSLTVAALLSEISSNTEPDRGLRRVRLRCADGVRHSLHGHSDSGACRVYFARSSVSISADDDAHSVCSTMEAGYPLSDVHESLVDALHTVPESTYPKHRVNRKTQDGMVCSYMHKPGEPGSCKGQLLADLEPNWPLGRWLWRLASRVGWPCGLAIRGA